ncbi:MAG: thiamine-phosphate kinase [Candidatus Bathyarchaeota archaeon]
MPHSELGERKIIDLVYRGLEKMPGTILPFGDDVSTVTNRGRFSAVLKTDMLVGKTDILPRMTLYQAARKAIVMCVSDFAAKGVKPLAALVALGIPEGFDKRKVKEIARGLSHGIKEYGAYIIGGDTNEADDLIIAPTLYGFCRSTQIIPRGGARPGDILAVSGLFGRTTASLKILLDGFKTSEHLRNKILRSAYLPEAKLNLGLNLKKYNVTASIDSSDGLAWSLHELAKSSDVGFRVNRLPIAKEVETFAETNGLDPFDLVFYGGEEYELVFTVASKSFQKMKKTFGKRIMEIGKVAKKDLIYETKKSRRKIEPEGWEHFKMKSK